MTFTVDCTCERDNGHVLCVAMGQGGVF